MNEIEKLKKQIEKVKEEIKIKEDILNNLLEELS